MDNLLDHLLYYKTRSSIYKDYWNLSTIVERVQLLSMTCLSPLTGYTIKRVSEIRGKTVQTSEVSKGLKQLI